MTQETLRFASRVGTLGAVAICLAVGSAGAQTLFTTQDDFTGWDNVADKSAVPQGSPDFDGSTTNGLAEGGGGGAAGSAVLSSANSFEYIFSDGLQGNQPLIDALGVSGVIAFDFDYPNGGTYFDLGLVLNYDGNFGQFFGGTDDNLDGTFTKTIAYTFAPDDLSTYFQIGVIFNSDAVNTPFNLDNVRIVSSVPAVPEPATTALAALAFASLPIRRRKS